LDVATKYAMSKEAVQANFNGKAKTAAHLSGGDGDDNLASAQCHRDKMAKDKKHCGKEIVATAECVARP
jgi:hypothetical protein